VHPNIEYDKKYKERIELVAGKTFSIPVKITGVPTPKVTWSTNEKLLELSSRINLDFRDMDHAMHIKNVTRQDAGIYTVSAENVVGRKHAEFELKVKGEF
jgi:titin